MKFLCVPCESPMTLRTVGPPERGSLSVVYSCPECGYEIAMLTNAYETQIVQSLGVRIGPDRLRAEGAMASQAEASAKAGTGCPFAAMIPATEGATARPGHTESTRAGAAERAPTGGETRSGEAAEPISIRWTAAAEARLANVPAFVRPMARAGIERFARERGAPEVDEQILDAAREFFGM